MSINKYQADKLFNTPNIIRDEPYVVPADVKTVTIPSNPSDKTKLELQDAAKFINFLTDGFTNVRDDYKKLLNVLLTRAAMRNISLAIISDNAALIMAVNNFFGQNKTSISFEEYVDILIYEYQIGTKQSLAGLTGDTFDVDSVRKHNITIIKDAFTRYLFQIGAEDLVIANDIIGKIANTNSSLSSLQTINQLNDGSTITDKAVNNDADNNLKDKLKNIIDDCIPCNSRITGTYLDFIQKPLFHELKNILLQKYAANLQQLLQLRFTLLGSLFSDDICKLINLLKNLQCLPDLQAIKSLLNMMQFKYRKTLQTKIADISLSKIDPIGMSINTTLDAIVTYLTQLVNSVFSSIECVLTSFEAGSNKVGIIDQSFYDTLHKGYTDTYNSVIGSIHEVQRMLSQDCTTNNAIAELMRLLISVKQYSAIVSEVYTTIKTYKSLVNVEGFWPKMYKSICAAAYGSSYPWLNVITDVVGPDTNSPIGDSVIGDPLPPNGNIPGGIIIGDVSLPKDFFDNDPLDIVSDPLFQQYYNNINFYETVETGPSPLRLNTSDLQRYRSTKQKLQSLQSTLRTNDNGNGGVLFEHLPVIFLSFQNCISSEGLVDYSQQQINEWINKVS